MSEVKLVSPFGVLRLGDNATDLISEDGGVHIAVYANNGQHRAYVLAACNDYAALQAQNAELRRQNDELREYGMRRDGELADSQARVSALQAERDGHELRLQAFAEACAEYGITGANIMILARKKFTALAALEGQ